MEACERRLKDRARGDAQARDADATCRPLNAVYVVIPPRFTLHSASQSHLFPITRYGHWAARGLEVKPHSLGLDSGCVYGQE
jgi:hypothetical protein